MTVGVPSTLGVVEPGHPLAEIDSRLQLEVMRQRDAGRDPSDPFRGLYITDAEAAHLASQRSAQWPQVVFDRLARLTSLLRLSNIEVAATLLALAPEIDSRYERVYAYLQDDVSRKWPSLDLVLRIAAGSPEEGLLLRLALATGGRLERVSLFSTPTTDDASRLSAPLRLDERVVAYLFGSDAIDRRLEAIVRRVDDGGGLPPPPAVARELEAVAANWLANGGRSLVTLEGPSGSGKTTAAVVIARGIGARLLEVDSGALVVATTLPTPVTARLVFREALLQEAPLYFSSAPALFEDAEASRRALSAIVASLEPFNGILILGGPRRWEPPAVLGGAPVVRIALPVPTPAERQAIWEVELAGVGHTAVRAALPRVASSFKLTPGQIRDAASVARARAAARSSGPGSLDIDDVLAASRAVSRRALAAVAEEVQNRAAWDDIVLTPDVSAQLRELCTTVRGRGTVLDEWGFAEKIVGGTGVTALFAGPSGTGKTMAAGIIARELGLPMFRVDLARVVSKWVGETEKNLDRIFVAAEDSNAIIFLDEAEAVLGKRSEVRDSHDRYANLEISYLLQRMELYDGVAMLATNMPHLIDEAFTRRLTFAVYFPIPGEAERRRIWETAWPRQAPRSPEVDFERLAKLKLTGGNIKNVLLAAAALAASEATEIAPAHLRHAVRREYQKLGKEIDPASVDL
jgi:SpoVK/Ycf46/Vps4 family AAA+-type ATPase